MSNKRPKLDLTKPAFFVRGGRLICIWPDGRIAKVTNTFNGYKWIEPCYCNKKIIFISGDGFGKFENARLAYNAMRLYEKFNNLSEAEFIGN